MDNTTLQRLSSAGSEHTFYLSRRQVRFILLYLCFTSLLGILGVCLAVYIYYVYQSNHEIASLILVALLSIPAALLGASFHYLRCLYVMFFDVQPTTDDNQVSDEAKSWANSGSLIYFYSRPPIIAIVCFFIFAAFSEGVTEVLFTEPNISDSGYMAIMVGAFLMSSAGGKVFEKLAALGDGLTDSLGNKSEETDESAEEEAGESESE